MDTIILHIALAFCQFGGNHFNGNVDHIMILGDPADYSPQTVVRMEYDSKGNLISVYHGTGNINEKNSQNIE